MFGFLGRRRRAAPRLDGPGPVYLIGDLHGCSSLLLRMIRLIREERESWTAPPVLVFLGDYIDRGPDTRGTLETLTRLAAEPGLETVFLRGNHEEMLLTFLEDPHTGEGWIEEGGDATLESYGLPVPPVQPDREVLESLSAALSEALGPHRAFLENTARWYRCGTLFCAHAGGDPRQPPERQTEKALLWGHRDFFKRRRRDGLWVAHGHVIVPVACASEGRIALDTGAYVTGRLSAARIDERGIAFLET